MSALAVCTAVYPGVETFLPDWYASVCRQVDRDFTLWIAVDGLTPAQVVEALGPHQPLEPRWVPAEPGDTPAVVRQRLFSAVTGQHDEVVLVDSDDVMHPRRVQLARERLSTADLTGCALRLVDAQGTPTGRYLGLPDGMGAQHVLPRYNVFGLSNTAWRADALEACLPVPEAVVAVDWFLVTQAWLRGARIDFDPTVGMDYRRHGSNTLAVTPPFTRAQVEQETKHALLHLRSSLARVPDDARPGRVRQLRTLGDDLGRFADWLFADDAHPEVYVRALNELSLPPMWWTSVAHPELGHLWS